MLNAERMQAAIHQLEFGLGSRIIRWLLTLVVLAAILVLYDLRAYHSFNSPDAMDAAQVARNLSAGRGFTTEFIRPFSIYLVQKHHHALHPEELYSTNLIDAAQVYTAHPDLANAPLYPLALAGLMKAWKPEWNVEMQKPFWSEGGNFQRYQPEFCIAVMNQFLLLVVVGLTYLLAKTLFDGPAAWLAAGLTLGSDLLWKFSVSGQSTLLLMVIFLLLAWCLVKVEETGRAETPNLRRQFSFALLAGLLTGLGLLTRYSFGWLIVPVVVFIILFGGARRLGLAASAGLVFAVVVAPWLLRNLAVSGTLFGTAGYAFAEGTFAFPGTELMQSLNPGMRSVFWLPPNEHKLVANLGGILQGDIFRLGGGWLGMLFFAGLLLGLRNTGARRLRHFSLMCLAVFVVVQALGKTSLSDSTPEYNSENLLALLTPFVMIFGVAFFLTLLSQMSLPSPPARYGVILLLAALVWQPLVFNVLDPVPTVAMPPYYPPDVQKFSKWMQPGELVMSDIPWAVAWYGDRQCAWTTINSKYEFFQLNDQVKPVSGLFLSMEMIDAKFYSEGMLGAADNWQHFAWQIVYDLHQQQKSVLGRAGKVALEAPDATQFPTDFPLTFSPPGTFLSGIFITDRQRW